MKEDGGLEQASETQMSPRTKQVKLLDRTGEMVLYSLNYIMISHGSTVYTPCLLKQTLLNFSSFFPQFNKGFFPHTAFLYSSYNFFSGGILHCTPSIDTVCIINTKE